MSRPNLPTSDVKVHHTKGCGLCGSAAPHTHTQAEWRAHIDADQKKPPADIHDLRRGRWYDEKPITSTSTGSAGGTGMSDLENARGGMMSAVEKMNEGLGAAQQAHASLEEAQGMWMRAAEGSGQTDVSEVNGLLAQSVNDQEQVRQQVSAAISAAEGVASRL